LEELNEKEMKAIDYMSEVEGIELLPDAAITFVEANENILKYILQINDKYYYQYQLFQFQHLPKKELQSHL